MAKKKKCKQCGKLQDPYEGSYFGPSGFFCSTKCAQEFIADLERKEKEKKTRP